MADSDNYHGGRRVRHHGDDRHFIRREELYAVGSSDEAGSSRQQIRLEDPRPGILRSRNEYVDVGKLPVRSRQHRRTQRMSSSSRLSADNDARRTLLQSTTADRRDRIDLRNNDRNFRPVSLSASENLSPTPNIDKSRSNKAIVFLPETATTSVACQRSAIPPGRAVRVVATPDARNGHTSSTYSVISKQPRPLRCKNDIVVSDCSSEKRKPSALTSTSLLDSSATSIICKRCGRCRCSACAKPRELPSRRICGDHCVLSAQSIVDAVSCMCCVKACLYHGGGHVYDDCFADDDFYENGTVCDCDTSCASLAMGDGICGAHSLWSCSSKSPDRCFRWTILGSAITCLPCLWFYLPLKTCAAAVEKGYVKCYDRGCRCEREGTSSNLINRTRRNRRSHTLPPELPSIAAAKKAAAASSLDLRPIGLPKKTRKGSLVDEEGS